MLIPKTKPTVGLEPLIVPVPKDNNFHIPEGRYRAKPVSVKKEPVEKQSGTGHVVKLLFEVQVPSLQKTINLARAEFRWDMSKGSELRNLITRLFGEEAVTEVAGGGFDVRQLMNMDVEIEIEHVVTSKRDQYKYPLVVVRNIQKLGTMRLNEYAEANQ